jgi:hypothetical protein
MMTNHIKVYKTTVCDKNEALAVEKSIKQKLPDSDVSFDLEDCDKVLRIETSKHRIDDNTIQDIISSFGRKAEPLPA